MVDGKNINELDPKESLSDSDLLAIANSLGFAYKVSLEELKEYLPGGANQFTDEEADELRALIFNSATQSLVAATSQFEKGVETDLYFSWNVNANDDEIVSITLDGTAVDLNDINPVLLIPDRTTTKSVTLTSTFVQGANLSNTVTSYARIPQYEGKMTTTEPPTTYSGLSAYSKLIQSSSNLTLEVELNNEYMFFVCTSDNKTVIDNYTGFELSSGVWEDETAFFIKKEFIVSLADGSTETMTLYRTRTTRNQTLNISLV